MRIVAIIPLITLIPWDWIHVIVTTTGPNTPAYYKATPAQIQQVNQALARVLATPKGQDMLSVLSLPGTPRLPIFVVRDGTSRSYFPTDPITGDFQPPVVIISPCEKLKANTTQGIQDVPLEAVIAHELAHAILGAKGYNGESLDPNYGQEEDLAREVENEVRLSLGYPARTIRTP